MKAEQLQQQINELRELADVIKGNSTDYTIIAQLESRMNKIDSTLENLNQKMADLDEIHQAVNPQSVKAIADKVSQKHAKDVCYGIGDALAEFRETERRHNNKQLDTTARQSAKDAEAAQLIAKQNAQTASEFLVAISYRFAQG